MKNRLVLLGVAAVLAVGLTAPAFGGANVVSSGATAAKSTADKALAKAIKANKKAKQAQASANAAQASADAAASAAAGAQTTADSALAAANGKYSVTDFDSTTTASDAGDKIQAQGCAPGFTLVSGGFSFVGADNAAFVKVNQAFINAWVVSAVDNGALAGNWSLNVSSTCIN